ncbi:hypothetical protein JOD45_000201 [Scopulibacillus daqui]|uniref:Uncharacterized protein n=1 Tax=Scopulibacillus daqui TaxID=1469162 RepID=A0ABS2PWS5_9BACL|nr:hypothetical protein [Scopulibacillus daqui]MBM7644010.1 hypothetical protein [Scopulibacillus daqui]
MACTLVYGGLSSVGLALCSHLTGNGQNVLSLSSACNDTEREQEEERELFIGRNALFHQVSLDDLWKDDLHSDIRHAFFLDLNKETEKEYYVSYQRFVKLLENLFKQLKDLRSLVMLSENELANAEQWNEEMDLETLFAKNLEDNLSESAVERAAVIRISDREQKSQNQKLKPQAESPLIRVLDASIHMEPGFHVIEMLSLMNQSDREKVMTYPLDKISAFIRNEK